MAWTFLFPNADMKKVNAKHPVVAREEKTVFSSWFQLETANLQPMNKCRRKTIFNYVLFVSLNSIYELNRYIILQ